MKSLTKLFRYGPGPSSSHTIAPYNAATLFKKEIISIKGVNAKVTLYGSLALTGIGHKTNLSIMEALSPIPCEVNFDIKSTPIHPLLMKMEAFENDKKILERQYISLGGGELVCLEDEKVNEKDIYPFKSFSDVTKFMKDNSINSFKDFALLYESKDIDEYLLWCLKNMFKSIEAGLQKEGKIPTGPNKRINLYRSAKAIYEEAKQLNRGEDKRTLLLSSYAYAVAESNACGDKVITSPTCGSSGILPAVLYYEYKQKRVPLTKLRDSLYVAGLIGNLVKQNASIAGSIGGCQAEVGTASSMAAAALCYINDLSIHQIEYAAECALEHFLGLSCDPVDGYVAIPCIERNGIGAIRAYTSYMYAKHIELIRKNMVSFDDVVLAMKLTGDSLSNAYKETSLGGLAKILK